MPVTSHDIAREAGVSQSTVSRALRGDPRVAPETLARVLDVARQLHYTPNLAARSLITNRTYAVAVLVSHIRNPVYPQLVDTLHDELSLFGYRTVLLNGTRDELVPEIQAGAVDGVVLASATLGASMPAKLLANNTPLVLLNRDMDDLPTDRVTSDNLAGAALAAEALVSLGHKRIGMISGPQDTTTGRDRERGFLDGLARMGREIDPRLRRTSDYTHQGGYQWGMELLRADPRPTAIFCANDVVAFGVLDAAVRMGFRVPGDLSIIGYDDIAMAGWDVFGLSTVHQPLDQMAKSAARMLVERIDQPTLPPRLQVFPANLVRRATTGPAPTA
jgi:LacI family transcriptional regulator